VRSKPSFRLRNGNELEECTTYLGSWIIHTALGINPAKELRTPDGRPMPITDQGQALTEILG
jgi:hypothetical protein